MAIHVQFDSSCNATSFQYQAFSSLDKHDNHVTEVTENIITRYVHVVRISKLANRQQAHVVI